jgi:membrane-associated protein
VDWLHALKDQIPSIEEIIRMGGLWALILIVFVETGLFCFFLPGDSLLVTAGLFAAKGTLNIFTLNVSLMVAAILGDSLSYFIGRKMGRKLYSRPNSFFFRKEHLELTREFYERHGKKTIILARFVPIVRTFAPVVAGVAEMEYRTFVTFNIVGGVAWVFSMTMTGYTLVKLFPSTEQHIEKLILLVIFISILPGIIEWLRNRKRSA